ncbi:hypothetical protein B0H14DRAFT_3612615 [Mycena olivaceomarginata]|nr:hypothetical protein B0H14DRAFT_3612615 [Mycena olivaceomarginata]
MRSGARGTDRSTDQLQKQMTKRKSCILAPQSRVKARWPRAKDEARFPSARAKEDSLTKPFGKPDALTERGKIGESTTLPIDESEDTGNGGKVCRKRNLSQSLYRRSSARLRGPLGTMMIEIWLRRRQQQLRPVQKELTVNEEIAASLPSRTLPKNAERAAKPQPPKKKPRKKDNPPAVSANSANACPAPPAEGPSTRKQQRGGKRNVIYIFFEDVDTDADGTVVDGSCYYKCYLGNREIIEVPKSANYNISKATSKAHFRWFQVLSKRSEPPTELERDLAQSKQAMTVELPSKYKTECDQLDGNIKAMLQKQAADARELVAKWVAVCDQPFIAVNKPEFREMLRYAALHPADKILKIPKDQAVKTKIQNMEKEMVKELAAIFK